MSVHKRDSTSVELSSQQLSFGDLHLRSTVSVMRMGKRLKKELDDRNMKPVDLCELIPDLDLGTLSALYSRDSGNSKFAPAIAVALGLELHWLLTGDGDKTNTRNRALRDYMRHAYKGDPDTPGLTEGEIQEFHVSPEQRFPEGAHHFQSPHEVPVVGTTQGGPPNNLWLELEYSVGYSDQYLEAATPDPHAYALRVVGNSMAPRMMEGDWLMVEPASEAQPGMEVVVRTVEGAVMVKRFSSRHSDTIILESTNEAFSRITLMANEVEFIHPVGGIFPPWKIKQRIGEQFAGAGRRATQQPISEERRRADQIPDNSDRSEFVPPIPRPMTIDDPRTTTKKEAKK